MYTDLPLDDPSKDKLGRNVFAKEIANGLVNSFGANHESIVIGINGSWGSGKSTLINFIMQEVSELSDAKQKKIIILNFNPWMFSGQSELQNIFLKELLYKFNENQTKLKSASRKLADFLSHMTWLKYVHQGTGEIVKDAQKLLEGISKEKGLQELKSELDQILIESDVKLYITIDDIDRLTPREISDILQLVKLNGNFANTIFILAFDREVVTGALSNQFGLHGEKYLEKIIQVDYSIPNISQTTLKTLFEESLKSIFDSNDLGESISDAYKKLDQDNLIRLFSSLRDVYRFNNSLKLRLPSIYKELSISDFFFIEALRIFRPSVYTVIFESKERLTYIKPKGKSEWVPFWKRGKPKESKNDFIDNLELDELSTGIIKDLFGDPELNISGISDNDLIRFKRVANPNYFDRYFTLKLDELDIPEDIFQEFIYGTVLKIQLKALRQIRKEGKLFRFLNWADIKSYKDSPQVIESMILATFRFSDEVPYEKEHFFSMDTEFMNLQRFCSKQLERIPDLKSRKSLIEEFISEKSKKPSFSTCYTINSILKAKHRWDENKLKPISMWYPLISDDKKENDLFERYLIRSYKKALKLVYKDFENKEIKLNGRELYFLFDGLLQYQKTLYKSAIKKLMDDDHLLLLLISECITTNYLSINTRVGFSLAPYQLFEGMQPSKIYQRIMSMNLTNLSDFEKSTVDFFMKAYDEGFREKVYYDYYTLEKVKAD